jgi:hypothetical protein
MLSKCKARSLNPITAKKAKEMGRRERGREVRRKEEKGVFFSLMHSHSGKWTRGPFSREPNLPFN